MDEITTRRRPTDKDRKPRRQDYRVWGMMWGALSMAALVVGIGMVLAFVWSEADSSRRAQMVGSCDTTCALQDYTGSEYTKGECWCERPDGPGRVVRVKVDVPTTKGTP